MERAKRIIDKEWPFLSIIPVMVESMSVIYEVDSKVGVSKRGSRGYGEPPRMGAHHGCGKPNRLCISPRPPCTCRIWDRSATHPYRPLLGPFVLPNSSFSTKCLAWRQILMTRLFASSSRLRNHHILLVNHFQLPSLLPTHVHQKLVHPNQVHSLTNAELIL